MQAVKQADTGPEVAVRRLLHGLGYRYRLHVKRLPGTPDIVFAARRKVVFVHGCFWHGHKCSKGKLPKSRLEYWAPKIAANTTRDARTEAALEAMGWQAMAVWQCQLTDLDTLTKSLTRFLDGDR